MKTKAGCEDVLEEAAKRLLEADLERELASHAYFVAVREHAYWMLQNSGIGKGRRFTVFLKGYEGQTFVYKKVDWEAVWRQDSFVIVAKTNAKGKELKTTVDLDWRTIPYFRLAEVASAAD